MDNKKKTYKTKKVNIMKLSAFYDKIKKEDKDKKTKDGKRNIR